MQQPMNSPEQQYQSIPVSSDELYAEGREMSHCVSSYARSCAEGRCAIYSLTRFNEEGTIREATIEVSMESKKIVQSRKKHNADLTSEDKSIIKAWSK